MFTTIMYGFINEVTRQPATADIPLRANRGGSPRQSVRHSVRRSRADARPVAKIGRAQSNMPGTYRVLADSFKRAAGFN